MECKGTDHCGLRAVSHCSSILAQFEEEEEEEDVWSVAEKALNCRESSTDQDHESAQIHRELISARKRERVFFK
jgi:hypothetical protein